MLKRIALIALIWACIPASGRAMQRYFNYCQKGGYTVTTQGLQSSNVFQQTFASCTVHVYLAGTTTLVTLYSDNLSPTPTPLANPFTSASDGYFEFYATGGRYDVQLTSSTGTPQYTWGDVSLCDPLGPNPDAACTPGGTGSAHNLLSTTHLDTIPASPPQRGDIITGQNQTSPTGVNPSWARLALGTAKQCVTSDGTDAKWDGCWWNVYNNGSLVGTEQGLNLIPGTNVTLTPFADNPGTKSVDVTLNSVLQVQNNGTAVGAESVLNLIPGSGVSLTPFTDSGGKINVTVNATGGGLGNCVTTGDVGFSTFCGGPVPESGPLSPPLIQSTQAANVSGPTMAISFLGPVTSGDQVLVLVSTVCYPALDCNPTSQVGSDVTDTLGTTFAYAGHAGARYFGTDAFIGTLSSSGDDTVSVSVLTTVGNIGIQEYAWLGTLDATGSGSTSSSGIYTATITTATDEDTLVSVTHSLSTSSTTDAVSIDPGSWNLLPLAHLSYGSYVTLEYNNSFAPTAGSYTERINATNLGGLSASGSTVIFAFKPSVSPRPTQAPPRFRVQNITDYPYQVIPLYGLSGSLGGSVLAAGACSGTTVAVSGAQVGNTVIVTPETYPGDGNFWIGYISAVNVATVKVCSAAGGTPTASLYDVRVLR